jgi:peptidoglycan/LPS O-acetylase OafA/YrhL
VKSSSGSYFVGIDHLRGLAAFTVFTWHFLHGLTGYPLAFAHPPSFFPLAVLDEGHVGVALFMTLSGYLFAKLLDGRGLRYGWFLWNRLLRLAPLLLLVVAINPVISHQTIEDLVVALAKGAVLPTWPNGGWSIAIELQFYLALPLILALSRLRIWYPLLIVVASLCLRLALFAMHGEVQTVAYFTIVGGIDQFVFGIFFYTARLAVASRHYLMMTAALLFTYGYFLFDKAGGFYNMPSYPSSSPIWVVLPTIEGAFFGALIAFYDTSFRFGNRGASWLLARIGTYSYSIYLWHFFVVFWLARFIDTHIMRIGNFYVGLFFSTLVFLLLLPFAAASYHFFELPFLRFRRNYLRASAVQRAPLQPAA